MTVATKKMSLSVTPELAREIRDAVRDGEYASISAVVRDALTLWAQERAQQGVAVEPATRTPQG